MYDDYSSVNWSSSPTQDHHLKRHHHQLQPPQPLRQLHQQQEVAKCRDRFGYHDRSTFLRLSCNFCYMYLFPVASTVARNLTDTGASGAPSGSGSSETILRNRRRSLPDISNETLFNETCSSMASYDCRRWRSCCEAADECCRRQLSMSVGNNASDDNFQCKATWDGLSCWDTAKPDSYETQFCPDYMLHSNPTS